MEQGPNPIPNHVLTRIVSRVFVKLKSKRVEVYTRPPEIFSDNLQQYITDYRTVEASAIAGQPVGFVARQSVKVDFSDIGTSLRMEGFLDGRTRAAHANLGVEKRLSRGVVLSADLSDPFRSSAATFGARVQRRW